MNIDTSSIEFFVQAAIAMIVITSPPDPGKILLFNSRLTSQSTLERNAEALKLALICAGILAGTALIGREFLQLFGINLGAFGVAGGLVVAGMGFEMLYGGNVSRAQGGTDEPEPSEETGLIVPLAIPLIAGPGAITTMITLVSADDTGSAMLAGLIAAGVVGLAVYASFAWLGDLISKLSPSTMSVVLRIGGLLLATIGIQLLLGGIGNFYGITG
ncbi:MAG: MarC family protein [Miltoncostaeaceae bacterium]